MPCYATGSAEGDARLDANEAQAELTKVSDLLCKACARMDLHHIPMQASVRKWWDEHQEIDRKRLKQRAADLQQQEDRKVAMKKLTPNDRAALGLPRYGDSE